MRKILIHNVGQCFNVNAIICICSDWHNLRFAALHEIGHALGLDESRFSRAVMYEDSPGLTSSDEPVLNEDDVYRIRVI